MHLSCLPFLYQTVKVITTAIVIKHARAYGIWLRRFAYHVLIITAFQLVFSVRVYKDSLSNELSSKTQLQWLAGETQKEFTGFWVKIFNGERPAKQLVALHNKRLCVRQVKICLSLVYIPFVSVTQIRLFNISMYDSHLMECCVTKSLWALTMFF